MITIKEVTTKKEKKAFVKFTVNLYKDSKYYVPPIISQEVATFDKIKNPIFETANAWLFLAYKNNKIVGRVAAIINNLEIKDDNQRKMRFGWFDFIDDLEVSKALLDKVESIGRQHNLDFTEGPVGFSNLDKVGVMSEGFDELGTMITWYNHPYYIKHYEHHGYNIEKKYIESIFSFNNVDPQGFSRIQALIKKRYNLKAVSFNSTKEVMPYADQMFDLFNESYSELSSFVAITEKQKAFFKKKFISFINPEYITFVMDKDDNMIGFAIVMPSFAKALQKAKGKLFPFGFTHLLKAKKHSKDVIFYLIGVAKEYQNKGIPAIIFNHYYTVFNSKGIENCIRTPELEDNIAIQQLWKNFDPKVRVRRSTYRKELN